MLLSIRELDAFMDTNTRMSVSKTLRERDTTMSPDYEQWRYLVSFFLNTTINKWTQTFHGFPYNSSVQLKRKSSVYSYVNSLVEGDHFGIAWDLASGRKEAIAPDLQRRNRQVFVIAVFTLIDCIYSMINRSMLERLMPYHKDNDNSNKCYSYEDGGCAYDKKVQRRNEKGLAVLAIGHSKIKIPSVRCCCWLTF